MQNWKERNQLNDTEEHKFYWHKLGLQYWAWLIKLTMISIIIITNLYRDSMICHIPSWIFIILWGLWSLFFDYFFLNSTRFTTKLRKRYQVHSYVSCPLICIASPIIIITHQNIYIYFNQGWGTLIHYSHSKTIAYLWFHSW